MNFEKIKGAEIVLRANDLLDGESVAVPPGLGFEYVSAGDLKVAGLGSAKVIQSGLNYWAELSDEELSLLSTEPPPKA